MQYRIVKAIQIEFNVSHMTQHIENCFKSSHFQRAITVIEVIPCPNTKPVKNRKYLNLRP